MRAKLHTAITLLGLITLFIAQQVEASGKDGRVFKVSEVGRDKTELLEIFKKIKVVEDSSNKDSFLVLQRLNSNEFLAYKYHTKTYTWSAADSMASIGGGGNVNSKKITRTVPDKSQLFCLSLTQSSNAVDDETIEGITTTLTDDVYSYSNTLGAKKSVKIYKQIKDKPTYTKERFIEELQGGREWTFPKYYTEECFSCDGDGRLSDFNGGGRCRKCEGKGHEKIDLLVKW